MMSALPECAAAVGAGAEGAAAAEVGSADAPVDGPAVATIGRFQRQDQGAFGDLVANANLELYNLTRLRCRYFHRCFVALERDQRILWLDRIAWLDQHFDDRDILEITDVGNLHVDGGHNLMSLSGGYALAGAR